MHYTPQGTLAVEIQQAIIRRQHLAAQRRAADLVARRYQGTIQAWARSIIELDTPVVRPLLHRIAERAA